MAGWLPEFLMDCSTLVILLTFSLFAKVFKCLKTYGFIDLPAEWQAQALQGVLSRLADVH